MGAAGCREDHRPDLRGDRQARTPDGSFIVYLPEDLRRHPGRRTQRGFLLLRSLRGPAAPPGEHPADPAGRTAREPRAASLRPGPAGHVAPLLPDVRGPGHVQRRVPQGPLHQDSGRRGRAGLPLCRIQALLQPLPAVRARITSPAPPSPPPARLNRPTSPLAPTRTWIYPPRYFLKKARVRPQARVAASLL